jgi:hypothetical protein
MVKTATSVPPRRQGQRRPINATRLPGRVSEDKPAGGTRPIPLREACVQCRGAGRRVLVRPFGFDEPLDVTDTLVAAIARELWQQRGGNDLVNWLEAEMLLHEALLRFEHNGPDDIFDVQFQPR